VTEHATAAALADALEPLLRQMHWVRRARRQLRCDGRSEARALADELRGRGWRAHASVGVDVRQRFQSVHVVNITGRRTGMPLEVA